MITDDPRNRGDFSIPAGANPVIVAAKRRAYDAAYRREEAAVTDSQRERAYRATCRAFRELIDALNGGGRRQAPARAPRQRRERFVCPALANLGACIRDAAIAQASAERAAPVVAQAAQLAQAPANVAPARKVAPVGSEARRADYSARGYKAAATLRAKREAAAAANQNRATLSPLSLATTPAAEVSELAAVPRAAAG